MVEGDCFGTLTDKNQYKLKEADAFRLVCRLRHRFILCRFLMFTLCTFTKSESGKQRPIRAFDIINFCMVDRHRTRRNFDFRDSAVDEPKWRTSITVAEAMLAVACAGLYFAAAHKRIVA